MVATTATACLTTQTVYTVIPKELRESLASAPSIRVSRHWWGAASTGEPKSKPAAAAISGAEKDQVIAALKTVPGNTATPGSRQMAQLGYPVQPYRITAEHGGKSVVLTICYECFNREIAIGKFENTRLALQTASRATLDRVLKRHGKPPVPPNDDELLEIKQVQEALATVQKMENVTKSSGIAPTGCGGGLVGW